MSGIEVGMEKVHCHRALRSGMLHGVEANPGCCVGERVTRLGDDRDVGASLKKEATVRGISMGSFCKALIGHCNSSIPWKVIWGPRAPTVMAFFVWCLAQGKILTTDHLIQRKNVVINWNFLSCDGKDNSRTSTGKELMLYVYMRSKGRTSKAGVSGFGGEKIITNWMTVGYGCSDRGPLGLQIDIRMYIDGELLLTVFYEICGFDFIPTGALGVRRVFEYSAIALVVILFLVGICHRSMLRRRMHSVYVCTLDNARKKSQELCRHTRRRVVTLATHLFDMSFLCNESPSLILVLQHLPSYPDPISNLVLCPFEAANGESFAPSVQHQC
ncbi:hypothetical protein CsSME_00048352 [Camellia sinensis var. sinensis]